MAAPRETVDRRPRWLPLLAAAAIVGAVFAAYVPALRCGFVWDDDSHLTENPTIVGPLGFKDIWITGHANYFPMATTTLWLEHKLWGLHPLPFHLVNIALHAGGALMLWSVLASLGIRGAWFGALVWALHPVQVESVAWISEIKNTQSGLFYLISIRLFLRWLLPGSGGAERRREIFYGLSLAAAGFAMLSKTSTVILPLILGLCCAWVEGRLGWRRFLRLIPFLAVALAGSAWTIYEQRVRSGAAGPGWDESLGQRLIIAGSDVGFYLGKLICPFPLIYIYPKWAPDAGRLGGYLAGVAVAGALAFLWAGRKGRLRGPLFALLCFLACLAPVLGFFNVYFYLFSLVSDHFQYLASMGVLALGGAALGRWAWTPPGRAAVAKGAACLALLTAYGAMDWRQCGIYRDWLTLFGSVVEANPACWMAYNNLGFALQKEGRLPEAVARYEKALALRPDYGEAGDNLRVALNNLGNSLERSGRWADAIPQYERALRIDPGYALAHNNLGIALARTGRPAEAIAEFETALRLKPGYPDAERNLEVERKLASPGR